MGAILGFFSATLSAQDQVITFAGGDTGSYFISADSVVRPLAINIKGKHSSLQGSTGPIVSPDQHWIAFAQKNDLWLCEVTANHCSQETALGQPSTKKFTSIEVLILAWSLDSRQLLFYLSSGDRECEDCDDLKIRKAPYGFYRFRLADRSIEPVELPQDFEFEAWLPDGGFIGVLDSQHTEDACGAGQLVIARTGTQPVPIKSLGSSLSQVDISSGGRFAVLGAQCSRSNFSKILKYDLITNELSDVSLNGVYAEYQGPKFSPSSNHIAWIRSHHEEGKESQDTVVVDRRPVYVCPTGVDYAWIDETRLGVICGHQLVVVDVDSGKQLSKTRLE